MEPWKSRGGWETWHGCKGFNGATAMEPWKRRLRDLHDACLYWLQWGHGDGAVEECIMSPVEKLIKMLQWGHGDGAVEERSPQFGPARLELLQWGHGDGAVEEHCDCEITNCGGNCFNGATAMEPWKRAVDLSRGAKTTTCFNGATAMEPWKRSLSFLAWDCTKLLQWGHGDGAVEESRGPPPAVAR